MIAENEEEGFPAAPFRPAKHSIHWPCLPRLGYKVNVTADALQLAHGLLLVWGKPHIQLPAHFQKTYSPNWS